MRSLPLPITLLLALAGVAQVTAQPSRPAAGHWEGITLPGTTLEIRVDLERSAGNWIGTIDIPVQALRNLTLGDVTADQAVVSFTMPGVPGDPKFAGTLAADSKTITGDFTQGGRTFPFRLERTAKPTERPGGPPPARSPSTDRSRRRSTPRRFG